MRGIYRYSFVLISAAALSFSAAAQNLDPTVEVSRAYEGNLIEVHKPTMEMAVPDTVQKFRLDFDYSVFDSPYKGSYEFNPYMASMRPAAVPFESRSFYLKAGAGYRLHPVADLIWSPSFRNKRFGLDVYAKHRSYVGDYRQMADEVVRGVRDADAQPFMLDRTAGKWNGYELATEAGVSGRYQWKKGALGFNMAYQGVHSRDTVKTRAFDALDLAFAMASGRNEKFVYDLKLDYRFAEDKMYYKQMEYLQEHVFGMDVELGPRFRTAHKVLFNIGADYARTASAVNWSAARMNVTPHYVLEKDRIRLDAGVRIDILVGGADKGVRSLSRQQYIYPDVHFEFTAIRNVMNIYAKAVGGNRLNTYSQLVERNRFADVSFGVPQASLLDSDVERVRAVFGLKGRIGTRFSYDLHAGYAAYGNMLFDAVYPDSEDRLHPAVSYAGCQMVSAGLDWLLDTERFKFDGTVECSRFWGFEGAYCIFAPAPLKADVSVEYNIRKRIYFGADCLFASKRLMAGVPSDFQSDVVMPGYADLGVSAEYAASRKLSLWIRGGNLLNMTIQRTPLYAEGGINFTVGICLNL